MNNILPFIILKNPQGKEEKLTLTQEEYTIGRLPEHNNISLPEQEGVITRIRHCTLQRNIGEWYLVDSSTNGTVIQRNDQRIEVQTLPSRTIMLESGDRIIIHDWQLEFIDPNRTKPIHNKASTSQASCPIVFNLSQSQIYRLNGIARIPIDMQNLRHKVIKFLTCLAIKNLRNNHQQTLCEYSEIIEYVWGDDKEEQYQNMNATDVHTLANELRVFFDNNGGERKWVENRIKQGYVLRITCEE